MNDKFVVLTEVYEESYPTENAFKNTKRGEIHISGINKFSLRKVLINVDHITVLKEHASFIDRLVDNGSSKGWAGDLDPRQGFTRVQLNAGPGCTTSMTNLVVLGGLELTIKKILDLDK